MGGGQLSRRLVVRVSFVLAAVFGFSLFVVTPAWAQACTGVLNVNITKRVAPSRGIAIGDPVNHVIEVSVTAISPLTVPIPCDVTIEIRDFIGPNLTYTGSSTVDSGSCTSAAGDNPVECTMTFTGVNTAGQSKTAIIRTTAEDPGPSGEYCDFAEANVDPSTNPGTAGADETGIVCGAAEGEPAPPANGGGGDLDEFDEGGFGGGFGGFGTGFSTVSTPLGGVDTGAGGTAGSNAAVPQIALASLLTIGFLLFGLRRLRRA